MRASHSYPIGSVGMANEIQLVIDISTSRYIQYREVQPTLANAYQAITNLARDEQRGRNDPSAVLRFLTRTHADANLSRACKDVFRQLGTRPMSKAA
jgi:hypothetical protein